MSIAVVSPEDQKIKLENSWESQEPSDKQAPAQQLTTVINNNRSNDEGLHSSAQQDQQSHYSMSTDGVEMEPGFESCAEDDAENETDEAVYPAEDDAAMDETDAASTMHSLANSGILMSLDNDELWNKFSAAGTEMIITKSGRRMFPAFTVSITGLNPDQKYNIAFQCASSENKRYKYLNAKWVAAGKSDAHMEELLKYLHPDSPASGKHWMNNKISFKKVKLTNNKSNKKGHIALNSMHKYLPSVIVSKFVSKKKSEVVHIQDFPQASFFAVTAYQNDQVTQLKIDYNPFAKAFRESPTDQDIAFVFQPSWDGSTPSISTHWPPHSPLLTPGTPVSPLLSPKWPPPSPLISPYHSTFSQAAAAATATLSHLPATGLTFGPSPLPQFASMFGSWEHTPYTFSSPGVLRSATIQPCSLHIQHTAPTSNSNTAGQ